MNSDALHRFGIHPVADRLPLVGLRRIIQLQEQRKDRHGVFVLRSRLRVHGSAFFQRIGKGLVPGIANLAGRQGAVRGVGSDIPTGNAGQRCDCAFIRCVEAPRHQGVQQLDGRLVLRLLRRLQQGMEGIQSVLLRLCPAQHHHRRK